MKTTADIPEAELEDLMRFTGAATKREAIVTAITDYNGVLSFSVHKHTVARGCFSRAPRALRAQAHEFRWVSVPRKAQKLAE